MNDERIDEIVKRTLTRCDVQHDPRKFGRTLARVVRDEERESCARVLKQANDALSHVWAAAGDALLSGEGVTKAYAHDVQRKVREAQAALREGRDA